MVIGPIGSGKTSLLLSTLGESYLLSGKYERKRVTTAYVEQDPFILSESV